MSGSWFFYLVHHWAPPARYLLRTKPWKNIADQHKRTQRHVHTNVSPLWSRLFLGCGVGLEWWSRTGLGGGGESSKQRGLLQPSSLICPITITHTSWHLNSPPCLACRVLGCFLSFFFSFFFSKPLRFHFWALLKMFHNVAGSLMESLIRVSFWKASKLHSCSSNLTLSFWKSVPLVKVRATSL